MRGARRFVSVLRAYRWRTLIAVVLAGLLAVTAGVGISWAAAAPSMTPSGPTTRVERGGLVLTLRVAAGPYFLRELLPVSVSLTNASNAPVYVPGPVDRNTGINGPCGSMLSVEESGGHGPTYRAPSAGWISCPGPIPAALAPGRTVWASDVLPITASGRLALTAHAGIYSVTAVGPGGEQSFAGIDPFEGHEPQLQLMVSPNVPPQRMILPVRFGTRVYVIAPLAAERHLRYLYTAGGGSCSTGNFSWEPITTPIIDNHPCAGQYGTWTYAVGAPGYAIAGETVSGISP
jgi:hypothetical protein